MAREIQPAEERKPAVQVDNDASDTNDEKTTTLDKVTSVDGDGKDKSATISTIVGEK